jgi:hypothetical protein
MLVQHSGFPHGTNTLEIAGRQAAEAGFRDLITWLYPQARCGTSIGEEAPAASNGMTIAMMASVRGGRVQVLQLFLQTRPHLKDHC